MFCPCCHEDKGIPIRKRKYQENAVKKQYDRMQESKKTYPIKFGIQQNSLKMKNNSC